MELVVHLPGYEKITVELSSEGALVRFRGECSPSTLELFQRCWALWGPYLRDWKLPGISEGGGLEVMVEGLSELGLPRRPNGAERRSLLLLRELVGRSKGQWEIPYQGEVVCTCRDVSAEVIDQSLAAGAERVEEVSQWTTACTSCTSCRSKILELMAYRRGVS